LHKKDLQNAVNAANSLSLPVPVTAQVFEILKSLVLKGYSELDHSSIIKYFEEISEIKI
jgi:2-hydroxy-3-oxopropionate reductase